MSAVERYLEQFARALGAVGIRGGLRRRILVEVEDHLRGDPSAISRFGDPSNVAAQFANELGTAASIRGACRVFAALCVAGVAYAAAFLSLAQAGSPDLLAVESPALGLLAAVMLVLAPQVAFVAGGLALVRARRRRGERACPAVEVSVLNRRTALGLLSGLLTMAALALFAAEFQAHLAGWWVTLALSAGGSCTLLLSAAAVPSLRTAQIRPTLAGESGDIFDDLGPLVPSGLRRRPWLFAAGVAVVAATATLIDGLVGADGYDGAIRAVFEAAACLTGFAVLGRYLGLRR